MYSKRKIPVFYILNGLSNMQLQYLYHFSCHSDLTYTGTFSLFQDILPLIEDLNNAGIRFVYFSAENELRSRVRCLSSIVELLQLSCNVQIVLKICVEALVSPKGKIEVLSKTWYFHMNQTFNFMWLNIEFKQLVITVTKIVRDIYPLLFVTANWFGLWEENY